MNLDDLRRRNAASLAKVAEFRELAADRPYGKIDDLFHKFKNHHPYFGFIDVVVGDARFVMFSGNDDLIAMTYHWYGPSSFERKSLALWLERAAKAKTILDIGAFTGVYALSAATANPGCRVYAFEPVRRTYGRLLLNIQANNLTRQVTCVNKGVADQAGIARINQFRQENILGNGASLMEKGIPVTSSDEQIYLFALDDFVDEQGIEPDLIKIDVEGAELLVLTGMKETLAKHRPEMIVEVTPKTAAEVVERLRTEGFDCAVISESLGTVEPFSSSIPGVANILVTPRP